MPAPPTGHGVARILAHDEHDHALLVALRDGDETVLAGLVSTWTPAMLRLALVHAPVRAVAEEVVQEAWLTVLREFERFEGRSSLRTWVLGIVVNLARSRARSERRSTPPRSAEQPGPVLDPGPRFRLGSGTPLPDHRAQEPTRGPTPEEALLLGEARALILEAIAGLPPAQRAVVVLRDVGGCSAAEACEVLGLSDANQRVLLHRARSGVRLTLGHYFGATGPTRPVRRATRRPAASAPSS